MAMTTEGMCLICQKNFDIKAMLTHLLICLKIPAYSREANETNEKNKNEKETWIIRLTSKEHFWLYVVAAKQVTLEDLDSFLRKVWLECCDHMSQFIIHKKSYSYDQSNFIEPLKNVLTVGALFDYKYDLGYTTHVSGEVMATLQEGTLKEKKEKIHVIARNIIPQFKCSTCSTPANSVCSICHDFCCYKCRQRHDCGDEEMILPIVNSPRTGICSYTG